MAKPKTTSSRPSRHRPFQKKVGLLGGGQLARMLALKAFEMGLEPHVLCPKKSEPAAQVAAVWMEGSPDSLEDVARFAATVDILTIESEFHSGSMLAEAAKRTSKPLFPSPESVTLWQDRAQQKAALVAAKVPTSPFAVITSSAEAQAFFKKHPGGVVFKKRQGGYDGYGTFIARNAKQLTECLTRLDFAKDGFIAEAFIPFKRELAVVFARNSRGQLATLPLVQTHQVDHRLDWLVGPVRHKGLSDLAKSVARLLKKQNYVGAIAFELFDTGRELLVNEVAPRVHNSGHYSLEALSADQFTLHLKAILNEDLSDPEVLSRSFALVNLIGAGAAEPQAPTRRRGHLHWYGKSESRKGRKMGHVTWVGDDAEQGLRLLLKERKGFQL